MILSSVGLGLAGEWLGYRWSFWLSAVTVTAAVSANCLLGQRKGGPGA